MNTKNTVEVMKKDTKAETRADRVLEGQFFHSIDDNGQVEWQGRVLGSPAPGWYLVQLFEWLCGSPGVRRLVSLEDMRHWLFYESAEAMCFSYHHGAASEGGKRRS